MSRRADGAGFTLIEVALTVAIAALLFAGIAGVVSQALAAHDHARTRNALATEARFAMQRMVEAVSRSRMLILPLADNPATDWREHVREQSVPAAPPEGSSTLATAVLAITLDPTLDRDGDGFADADNDKDGRVDEDLPWDSVDDLAPGIAGIDDDGDGAVDEPVPGDDWLDNDEDGQVSEDPVDGVDNDGDGSIDEDPPRDMNGDGAAGVGGVDDDGDGSTDEGYGDDDDEDGAWSEDWRDAVVYFLSGSSLVERMPALTDVTGNGTVDGNDYEIRSIAEHVSHFRVERVPRAASDRAQQVDISLTLSAAGHGITVQRRVRLGAGL